MKNIKKAKAAKTLPINKIKLNPKLTKILVIVLAIICLGVYFKNLIIVAWVNGQPISWINYNRELSKVAGKQTLESLITKTLINAEAKKQKIQVTKEEISQEISRIESYVKEQGSELNELLTAQGMTRKDLEEELRLQKLVEKMVGTDSAAIQEWLINLQTQAKIIKW